MNSSETYYSTFNSDASETIAYNNPLFPVYIRTGYLSQYPDYAAISHWHADLEFVIIRKGSMTYNVNGVLTKISENQAIMVNSRQLHYGFSPEKNECEFICILFSPELFRCNSWFYENFIEVITENSTLPYFKLDDIEWQGAIIDELLQIVENPAPFSVMEHSYRIMELLFKHLPILDSASKSNSSDLLSLKNMIAYLDTHYASHISLSDIASVGTCCQSKCCSLFKKYLHDTPISYLTKLRLRKSLNALIHEDLDITDVALNHGFGGSSYYCETFRKYYGMSPLQYRKQHQ